MTVLSAAQPTLIGRLWPQTAGNSMARAAALILIGSALMAIAAHIQVPFWPVKLSMQSFVAIVIGSVVVSRIAALLIKKLLTTLVLGWLDHVAGAVAGAAVGSRGGGNVNLPADRRSAERRSYPLQSPGAGKSRKEPRMGPTAQISLACSTST